MSFAAQAAAMDAAIAGHLCEPGTVVPINGASIVPVSLILTSASEAVDIGRSRPVRDRATVEIPTAELRELRDGDVITTAGRRWRVQGQPTRPDDGRWWIVDVSDLGEA